MKRRATKQGRWMLLVLLVGSLLAMWTGTGLVLADPSADPVRELPPGPVGPGDEFTVTVTFVAPANLFEIVGLTDQVPDGWLVTVDAGASSPAPSTFSPPVAWSPGPAEYIWFGPYNEGQQFTALYHVRVPVGAEDGDYSFSGGLTYTIAGTPGYSEVIGGDSKVTVREPANGSGQVGLNAHTTAQTGCLELIKAFEGGVGFPGDEIEVRVTGPGGFDETYNLTAGGNWTKVICELEPGIYTVEELTAEQGWRVTYDPEDRQVDVPAGGQPVITITNTYTTIGISVTPSVIDFGEIAPGASIVDSPDIVVTNIGAVDIDVSAELDSDTYYALDSYFYTEALKLNGFFSDHRGTPSTLGAWTAADLGLLDMAPADQVSVSTGLDCPEQMYAATEYTGTLIFWAVATGD